jgi:hypothetical protein
MSHNYLYSEENSYEMISDSYSPHVSFSLSSSFQNPTECTDDSISFLDSSHIFLSSSLFIYEVCFKTCVELYTYHEKIDQGEIVTVQCERGYNIGFISKEILKETLQNENEIPTKRILAKLLDEDNTIKDMLKYKIVAEKNALSQCRIHCKGHRLGSFADAIAADFQFDRKKLTVFLRKYEDVSVCRLVRKLYDTYKMRIKILEVEDPEVMKEMTKKYLDISKLNVQLSEAFNFDPSANSSNKNSKNKSDKNSIPNFSKSHIGQSTHLIPALVQYGPQADKRHTGQGYPISTSGANLVHYAHPHHERIHGYNSYHGQDLYDPRYSSHNSVQRNINRQSPTYSGMTRANNWYGTERRFFPDSNSHSYAAEPFGHEGSLQQQELSHPTSFQFRRTNYNDSIRESGDYHPSYRQQHPVLQEPLLIDHDSVSFYGRMSDSSYASSVSISPTSSISPSSQSSQTSFHYPEIPF